MQTLQRMGTYTDGFGTLWSMTITGTLGNAGGMLMGMSAFVWIVVKQAHAEVPAGTNQRPSSGQHDF